MPPPNGLLFIALRHLNPVAYGWVRRVAPARHVFHLKAAFLENAKTANL